MKFDLVVGNPPYNDSSTTVDESIRRGFAGGLHVKFIDRALKLTNKGGVVSIVAPSNRFMSGRYRDKNLDKYMQLGLKSITSADSYFNISLEGVVVYTFEVGVPQSDLVADCLKPAYDAPANNLSKYHHRSKGAPRRVVDALERDEDGAVVYCTTSIKIKVVNPELVEDRHSDKWRVIYNANGTNKTSIGKVLVAKPGEYLSGSVNYMVVESEEQAELIRDAIDSDESKKIQAAVRVSCANSAYHMSFIADPSCTFFNLCAGKGNIETSCISSKRSMF